LTSFFVGRGLPMTTSISAGLVAGSNLLLNLWCIPRYGIRGAAVVSTVSYTLGALYLLWAYRRLTGLSYARALLVQCSDVQLVRQIYSRFKNTFAHEQPAA
jgi:Na+-driven multidrug efflux pump